MSDKNNSNSLFCINKKTLKKGLTVFSLIISVISIFFLAQFAISKNLFSFKSKAAPESSSKYLAKETYSRKVHLIIFNPRVSDNSSDQSGMIPLSQWLTDNKLAFNDPNILTSRVINSFRKSSGGRLDFRIVRTTNISEFPVKTNGYKLNLTDFKYCTSHWKDKPKTDEFKRKCETGVDYNKILNTLKICDQVNKGQVDEVWMWGYAWFGFSESALVGPDGFAFNGVVIGDSTCNKLVPIMGFNYERGLGEALHDFIHRMEATMTTVYKNWSENRTVTKWDLFGLVKAQSKNYNYSGCGSAHYTPTSEGEYEYDTGTKEINTVCDNFSDYDTFNSKELFSESKAKKVNCKSDPWLCTQEGYSEWWFSRLPKFIGVGSDGVLNDWLAYFADPSRVKTNITNHTFRCEDFNEFGLISEGKECNNKSENNNQCQWYGYCNKCSKSGQKISTVCNDYCQQYDNNIDGCVKAQSQGTGCVWYADNRRCVAESANYNLIKYMTDAKQVTSDGIDVKVTVNYDGTQYPYLTKKLYLEISYYNEKDGKFIPLERKLMSDKPVSETPYRITIGAAENLDKKKKYVVYPVLEFPDNPNPPSYKVTQSRCTSKECAKVLPIAGEFVLNIDDPVCYNLPKPTTCSVVQDKCSWSHDFDICHPKTKNQLAAFPSDYCRSIKSQTFCDGQNYCQWSVSNQCVLKIFPTPSPTLSPDTLKHMVSFRLYNKRYDNEAKTVISREVSYRADKFVKKLKWRVKITQAGRIVSQVDQDVKFSQNTDIILAKKGQQVTVELWGDIADECKNCAVSVLSSYSNVLGRLTPSSSAKSYNSYSIKPDETTTFRLYVNDSFALTGDYCKKTGDLCYGSNESICYYFPQIVKSGDKCLHCYYGIWKSTPGCY